MDESWAAGPRRGATPSALAARWAEAKERFAVCHAQQRQIRQVTHSAWAAYGATGSARDAAHLAAQLREHRAYLEEMRHAVGEMAHLLRQRRLASAEASLHHSGSPDGEAGTGGGPHPRADEPARRRRYVARRRAPGRLHPRRAVLAYPLVEALTTREREVLRWMAAGDTNRQIAQRLSIAPSTAKVHVEHILAKLGVGDRTRAAVLAVALGLVASPAPAAP